MSTSRGDSRTGDAAPPPEVPLFDAGGALSREYLQWRGYCCRNGCRNCPYGFQPGATPPPDATGACGGES